LEPEHMTEDEAREAVGIIGVCLLVAALAIIFA
jgi:hypothetical protein